MRRMYIKFIDAICDLRNVFLISAGIVISVLTIYFLRYELLKALIKMDGGIGRFKRNSRLNNAIYLSMLRDHWMKNWTNANSCGAKVEMWLKVTNKW